MRLAAYKSGRGAMANKSVGYNRKAFTPAELYTLDKNPPPNLETNGNFQNWTRVRQMMLFFQISLETLKFWP
jgi:hypothetical protein